MAQHDYVIANGTGAAVRSDLNNALAAIVSQNSGATAPATTYAYMWWADTTTGLLKLRNAANNAWITLFQLDGEWSTLAVENGSASAPSIYFKDSGTDTGFYSPAANEVAVATNGTGRLFVNSSGSVGIGTSSPNVPLQVIGGSTVTDPVIRATNSGATQSMALTSAGLRMDGGAPIQINQGGSEVVRIDTSGRVGIGTTSPGAVLDCKVTSSKFIRITDDQATSGTGVIRCTEGDGTNRGMGVAGNFIAFLQGADNSATITERARIDSSGRLLVGTSSSASSGYAQYAKVQINASTLGSSTEGVLALTHGISASTSIPAEEGVGIITFANGAGGEYARIRAVCDGTSSSASDLPGRLVFSTCSDGSASPQERMRIKNDGEVLINKTSSFAVAHKFAVEASNQVVGIGTGSGTGLEAVRFYNGGTAVGTISTTASSTAYNTSSDYRLKENVTTVTDGIARLQQLKPSRFNFIADPDTVVDGFIAHEVQTVIPEAITGAKDAVDPNGNPVYQGIDQSKLVPLLTAALQEAIGRIETLETEVAALKAQ